MKTKLDIFRVGAISTKLTFYFIKVKKILQKCQPGVGRWSKRVKNLSTYFLDDPLAEFHGMEYLFSCSGGSFFKVLGKNPNVG